MRGKRQTPVVTGRAAALHPPPPGSAGSPLLSRAGVAALPGRCSRRAGPTKPALECFRQAELARRGAGGRAGNTSQASRGRPPRRSAWGAARHRPLPRRAPLRPAAPRQPPGGPRRAGEPTRQALRSLPLAGGSAGRTRGGGGGRAGSVWAQSPVRRSSRGRPVLRAPALPASARQPAVQPQPAVRLPLRVPLPGDLGGAAMEEERAGEQMRPLLTTVTRGWGAVGGSTKGRRGAAAPAWSRPAPLSSRGAYTAGCGGGPSSGCPAPGGGRTRKPRRRYLSAPGLAGPSVRGAGARRCARVPASCARPCSLFPPRGGRAAGPQSLFRRRLRAPPRRALGGCGCPVPPFLCEIPRGACAGGGGRCGRPWPRCSPGPVR